MAAVSFFMFCKIESLITRALSKGFSVGVSLSGENQLDVSVGTKERCFVLRLKLPSRPAVGALQPERNNVLGLLSDLHSKPYLMPLHSYYPRLKSLILKSYLSAYFHAFSHVKLSPLTEKVMNVRA